MAGGAKRERQKGSKRGQKRKIGFTQLASWLAGWLDKTNCRAIKQLHKEKEKNKV